MSPATPCKRSPNGITKVVAKSEIAPKKNSKIVHGCIVGNEWNLLSQKIMKIASQAKVSFR